MPGKYGLLRKYEEIRSWKHDIERIAKNTGWDEFKIERIKNHLFYENHTLYDGIRQFDPDPDIAASWLRLIEGSFEESDIKLLKHEYFESRFEKLYKVDYRTAHAKTKLRYPWTS